MIPPITRSADQIDLGKIDQILPRYEELLARALPVEAVPAWLADWSKLQSQVGEAASLVSIEHSRDTQDPDRKAAYMHMVKEVQPKLRPLEQKLKQRLLASGYAGDEMAMTLRDFRSETELFRAENVPLMAEEQAVASRYDDIAGTLTAEFEGKTYTLAQLQPFRAATDRKRREAAWKASMDAYLAVRPELDALYAELMGIREKIASNAGFDNYLEFRWKQLGRFDYSPDDAERFHEAIFEAVVPALQRRTAARAARLGLERLRPWDIEVDPLSDQPLTPFTTGEELAEGSARIFDQVGPILGERVREMQSAGLLDLDNRKGKAPGGYCATLPARGLPFIFMNSVGTDDNLRTMLHEAGHAFHVFETKHLPLVFQRHAPMEFCEVASMSMELLASPFIGKDSGGFYEAAEAQRSRIQHLERMLFFLPYMATVSAFQHWAYRNPGQNAAAWDAQWLKLHERFNVGVDWSGHEQSRMSLWHQKLHIFRAPFYYIEYGIAQMGALQVWRNSKADPQAALEQYSQALALGRTRSLPDLFEAAGARLAFDTESVAELVYLIENEIGQLEAALAG
jgi:oligoendopeptidase F